MKALRILAFSMFVALLAIPGYALQGARQGCLTIDNRAGGTAYTVTLNGTNVGTYTAYVPPHQAALVVISGSGNNAKMLVVSEDSTYSALGKDKTAVGKISFKDDPNTAYASPLNNPHFPQCHAGWYLPIRCNVSCRAR